MALRTGSELHNCEHSAMRARAEPEAWVWAESRHDIGWI